MNRLLALSLALLAALGGCGIVAERPVPAVNLRGEVRNQWVRRGMLQTENPVLQGRATISVPTRWADADEPDEFITVDAFANMDLSEDAGDAWFPDGNGGDVTAFDLTGSYSFLTDAFDFTTGVTNYSLPFGPFFPNGPRGATNELFAILGTEVLGVRPELQLHYDFDRADGFYFNFNLSEDFTLTDELKLRLLGGIGYSTGNQSLWDYAIEESGLSDARLAADLSYAIDTSHVIGIDVAYTTMVDSGLRDWFDLIRIDTDTFGIGIYALALY